MSLALKNEENDPPTREATRFAPTTSGRAHPGTLLSAMLTRLDAWRTGARFVLRWEDIDPTARARGNLEALQSDLEWFGLEWDETVVQSNRGERHAQALDEVARQGKVYACSCSRAQLRRHAVASASGGWVYPGTCRKNVVRDWRSCGEGLRVDLSGVRVELRDESGLDLSQTIDAAMGDPLVRRADGGFTYQWAVVVDDIDALVTRVVRGRDIASSSATQAALYDLLDARRPRYRHHFLLLEPHGEKLAKFHQSISVEEMKKVHSPHEVLGFLAWVAGLVDRNAPASWDDVRAAFSWDRVRDSDQIVTWNSRLEWITE